MQVMRISLDRGASVTQCTDRVSGKWLPVTTRVLLMQFSAGSPRAQTLAAVLRETRDGVGISQRELSRRLNVANTTVGRWEKGLAVPSPEAVAKVLDCLEIYDDEERDRILALASSRSDDWLVSGIPGMTQQVSGLMNYERTARHITQWAPLLIPGVLQTSDYARAMMSAQGTLSPSVADARVNLRMARRDAVTRRRNPTELVALIGEPAIRGGIGGREVMGDQLCHLVDLAASDNITLHVVHMSGEWHPGHSGPFMIYEFERMRPAVYLEHHRVGAFVVEEDDVGEFRAAADIIRGVGMSPEEDRKSVV